MGTGSRAKLGLTIVALVAAFVGMWLGMSAPTNDATDVRAPVAAPPAVAPAPVPKPSPAAQTVASPPAPRVLEVAPPAPAADETTVLTGIVEDARGKPVAGASIAVLAPSRAAGILDLVSLIGDLATERPAAAIVTSGRDGRFSIVGLEPGAYVLTVRKSGQATSRADVTVRRTPSAAVTIGLGTGYRIEGSVVRTDATPAADVAVVALSRDANPFLPAVGKSIVRTDANGGFAFDDLPAGQWQLVAVPANEGCSKEALAIVPPAEATAPPIVLTIDGADTLTGRVTDEDGAAVAGAKVLVGFAQGWGIGFEHSATTVTDADGRYELRGLASATAELFLVLKDGFAPHRGRVQQADGARTQDVKLTRGGTVKGVVTDRSTKAPVARATIVVVSASTMIGGAPSATSAADGTFVVRGVPVGRSVLTVTKSGWSQPDALSPSMLLDAVRREAAGEKPPEVRDAGSGAEIGIAFPGDVVERRIELFRPIVVRGRVLAPDGTPVARARIRAVRDGEPPDRKPDFARLFTGEPASPVSDADGRFEIESPVAAGRVSVEATAEERQLRASRVVEIVSGSPPAEVEIRLGTGASILGRVTDAAAGEPAAGVWVGWWTNETKDESVIVGEHQMGIADTAADGTYRVDLVTPGAVRMEVRGTTDRKYLWQERVVHVEEDKVLRADFQVERALSISGRALLADGRPALGANVEVQPADASSRALPRECGEFSGVEPDGAFLVKMLPPGRYRIVATVGEDAHASAPVVASAGASNVELRFGSLLSLAGIVRFKDGTPVAGVSVSPWPAEPDPGRGYRMIDGLTGADGSFRFDGLEAGPYNITVGVHVAPGLSIRPARLEGIAAGTVNLVIELDRGASISGRVLGPDGSPLASGTVRCSPMFASDEPLDFVNAEIHDGRFELLGLAVGKQYVVVEAPGFASTRVFTESGARNVVIRVSMGGKIKGRVLLPDGKPAVSADVWIEDGDGEGSTSASAYTGEDGSFVIEAVGPGVHRVGAAEDSSAGEKEGRPPHTGEAPGVRVAEGATVENVEIRLAPNKASK